MLPKLVAEPATEQAGGKAERHPAGSFDRRGELEVEPVRGGAEGLRAGCLQPEITISQESSPKLVLSLDFRESMEDKNRDSFKVTWDGDFATWLDFVSGRAWLVTQEIDHKRLSQPDGAKYLVDYVENGLAKTPVPDAGVRAELLLRHIVNGFLVPACARSSSPLQRALQRARQENTQPDLPRPEQSPSSSPTTRRSHARTDVELPFQPGEIGEDNWDGWPLDSREAFGEEDEPDEESGDPRSDLSRGGSGRGRGHGKGRGKGKGKDRRRGRSSILFGIKRAGCAGGPGHCSTSCIARRTCGMDFAEEGCADVGTATECAGFHPQQPAQRRCGAWSESGGGRARPS